MNFVLTFLASQTFLRGKFEKRKLFLSNSGPKKTVHVSFLSSNGGAIVSLGY